MSTLYSKHPRWAEVWDEDLKKYVEREVQDRRVAIVPDCCDQARLGFVRLAFYVSASTVRPRWKMDLPRDEALTLAHDNRAQLETYRAAPRHCPFCGELLPTIQARQDLPDGPIWTPDGEDHCGTCGERNRECLCWSPIIRWETLK